MERKTLRITLLISLGLHVTIFSMIFLPGGNLSFSPFPEKDTKGLFRDIIVNVNQDDMKKTTRATLLSDRDSTASGHITKKKGDRWLNNSRYFYRRPSSRGAPGGNTSKKTSKTVTTDDSSVYIYLTKNQVEARKARRSVKGKFAIPDKYNTTKRNAIFYSNDGNFSFNTQKFPHFDYFRRMKDKIAYNWNPPLMGNAVIIGYPPGISRIRAIPGQKVKIYFTMDRSGKILNVVLLDSLGYKALDESCLDAIRNSVNFGPVPKGVKGNPVVIPFIFGYFVR